MTGSAAICRMASSSMSLSVGGRIWSIVQVCAYGGPVQALMATTPTAIRQAYTLMFSDIKLVVRLVGHPRDLGAVLDHGAPAPFGTGRHVASGRCLLWNALRTQLRNRARSEKCQETRASQQIRGDRLSDALDARVGFIKRSCRAKNGLTRWKRDFRKASARKVGCVGARSGIQSPASVAGS